MLRLRTTSGGIDDMQKLSIGLSRILIAGSVLITGTTFSLAADAGPRALKDEGRQPAISLMASPHGAAPVKRHKRRHGAKHAYGQAGKHYGQGGKRFGKNIRHGKPIKGGKELGKGVGKGSKNVGQGTARVTKKVARKVKHAVTP
jgi:hypothetical protein